MINYLRIWFWQEWLCLLSWLQFIVSTEQTAYLPHITILWLCDFWLSKIAKLSLLQPPLFSLMKDRANFFSKLNHFEHISWQRYRRRKIPQLRNHNKVRGKDYKYQPTKHNLWVNLHRFCTILIWHNFKAQIQHVTHKYLKPYKILVIKKKQKTLEDILI